MVVGIDVYHDKGSGKSCAAIVCSTDRTITRYYSEVIFQENKKELIEKLAPCFINAVSKYHQVSCMYDRMFLTLIYIRMLVSLSQLPVCSFMCAAVAFTEVFK